MQFKFFMPTKVISGRNCLKENKPEFQRFGAKAFIVTGKHSGKASGALDEVTEILKEIGVEYTVFNGIENNPTLENVNEGGLEALQFGADFIIGIGGGSPLDASKAIAVLAVNRIEPVELYKSTYEFQPLPIIAIPTTAGTGSEVTPYSILTRRDMQTKMSFGNESIFPKVAFLDPRYTETLNYEVTVNTAVDAFSHAVEGYLSKRSTPLSDVLALEAIALFGKCINSLVENNINFAIREKLLYMSMLGGMVIAHTGTTIVHGLGYSLTYFKDIPHGKANGLLMKEYFIYNYGDAREKIDNILRLLNMKGMEEFGYTMNKLLGSGVKLSDEEIKLYSSHAMKQRSTSYNIRTVEPGDMTEILKKAFLYE